MDSRTLFTLLLVASSGVAGCAADSSGCAEHPAISPDDTDGNQNVTLWMDVGTESSSCVQVDLAQETVFRDEIPASSEPGGHGFDRYAAFNSSQETLAVTVRSLDRNLMAQETFEATDRNHLIISVGDDQIDIQHEDEQPNFG